MRIVIDMQGAQASNKDRGIGRYSTSLALAMVRNRGKHEILLALNDLFPETIEPIRTAFDGLLPQENIRVWGAVESIAHIHDPNEWRRKSAEHIREAFLANLSPDVVHVTSLFEGLGDDAATSIGHFKVDYLTAVTLYDLIPHINQTPYLDDPPVKSWYQEKIDHLKKANLWLAISESSRQEGITSLGLAEDHSVNISTDADVQFRKLAVSAEKQHKLERKYGISLPFVMYTGGIDHRKNIEGLIRAFSCLPEGLRKTHQLAIVCSVQPESRRMLELLGLEHGLTRSELILAGYVPEEDLIALYNLCSLFVFPSWHEGFGLPALEAMRCGAPVIGANTSSLPEVIGLPEALFDPHSDQAITEKITYALNDDQFRKRLVAHGQNQATKFCWDTTALRAIDAMENTIYKRNTNKPLNKAPQKRPRLAFLSPLPPEPSGIATYSAELLPALSEYYAIEVIIDQENDVDLWTKANCPVHSVQWFKDNHSQFDRVLYHFGNSAFHQHMFELLRSIPGVVVLHDFFLSGVLWHMDAHGYQPNAFSKELDTSHGYSALKYRHQNKDVNKTVWTYPCSFSVIQDSIGLISHSQYSKELAKKWYGKAKKEWTTIPLLRETDLKLTKADARKILGFSEDDFVLCSFGIITPTKLSHRLLRCWLDSGLGKSSGCHLIFVGDNQSSGYCESMTEAIKAAGATVNICITGWCDDNKYHTYLAAADVGVQLRSLSRGETSAAVLDCMNYGLATIVNANGSMAELDQESIWMLDDEFTDHALVHALETLWQDKQVRQKLGFKAREVIIKKHNPARCAKQYSEAIEQFYSSHRVGMHSLVASIAANKSDEPCPHEIEALSNAIATCFPPSYSFRQLLVDVSELVQRDSKTGIQRVVRNVLLEWLLNPPIGWQVMPVYAAIDQPYRYARQFTAQLLEMDSDGLIDEPIDYSSGDVFVGLDLCPLVQIAKASFFSHLRNHGVVVKFLVYDLLCVTLPQFFVEHAAEGFSHWLKVVGETDGAICISKSVADQLVCWMEQKEWKRQRPFTVEWNHLGADVDKSLSCTALPGCSDADEAVLATLRSQPSFLMVGTLEPRKGHAQVLDAFEQLWRDGSNVKLVMIGKQGWMVDDLVDRINKHQQSGKSLFWLDSISDDYLEKAYAACSALVAASYGEGFGLPLIEAARHNLPIIARDIPVFREVAGEHAHYFDGEDPDQIAQAIRDWLVLYDANQHPKSTHMPWISWKDSANKLVSLLCHS